MTKIRFFLIFHLILICCFSAVCAEEGMWLYTNPPTNAVMEKYGFRMTSDWLEHLQKASVRFGNSGSASFVSPDGLVMTNHHVGVSVLQKMSTAEQDYVKNGFYARIFAEELKCPDVELNVLQNIEDVTEKVNAAVRPAMTAEQADTARKNIISEIEKQAADASGLKCTVSAFFQGGLYHLYYYKKYDDVRLVFAPETAIGFFGGDPDNYEFPRYCLDVTFFRAYENDQPAKVEHYLKWSPNGATDGELVFVSGHPGRTDRLQTVAHLKFLRDVVHPYTLEKIYRKEVFFKAFAERNADNARRVHTDIFRWTNYRKRYNGILLGLQDSTFMKQKEDAEQQLRNLAMQKRLVDLQYGDPWFDLEKILRGWNDIFLPYDLVEDGAGFNTPLFDYARKIVRLALEQELPDEQRLLEYREANLESLKKSLLAETPPIQKDIEILKLTDSLGLLTQKLGAEGPLVRMVLAGKSPQGAAIELIRGTSLEDREQRRVLIEGGLHAVRNSEDPMIKLAIQIDPASRDCRRIMENEVHEPMRQAYTKIADIRFKTYGTSVYPDATFTLRLSYGQVKSYTETDGTFIPALTHIRGLYQRAEEHGFIDPYALPQSWMDAKSRVNLDTPMNLISTHDIVGGNSGSPMVNAKNEVVGLVFDGNVNSLVLNFIYDDTLSRTVSVHSSVILEALRNVYAADRIVKELTQSDKETL